MSKLKYLMFVFGTSVLLFLMLGIRLIPASAQDIMGFTETPTEVSDTATPTEEITDTPTPTGEITDTPTPTNTEPPPPPPGPTTETPTPTVTETPEETEPEEEREPTRTPAPALPETGQAPPAPTGLDWRGLFAVLLFALVGTFIFRAVNRFRESR